MAPFLLHLRTKASGLLQHLRWCECPFRTESGVPDARFRLSYVRRYNYAPMPCDMVARCVSTGRGAAALPICTLIAALTACVPRRTS